MVELLGAIVIGVIKGEIFMVIVVSVVLVVGNLGRLKKVFIVVVCGFGVGLVLKPNSLPTLSTKNVLLSTTSSPLVVVNVLSPLLFVPIFEGCITLVNLVVLLGMYLLLYVFVQLLVRFANIFDLFQEILGIFLVLIVVFNFVLSL